MTSFVLFPQASEPIMNLYISKLVYYEVRKYEIMSEAIEEHMVKSLGAGLWSGYRLKQTNLEWWSITLKCCSTYFSILTIAILICDHNQKKKITCEYNKKIIFSPKHLNKSE